ncbi:hypothetical protein [Photobacterium leiognathi]|uniref:hypothetical protein n=1 Tax=Photobacterium leiognathi TaxID=553611 RepID=UPI002982A40E|nr:hypothetical protein [Photobacterium leiognathi]
MGLVYSKAEAIKDLPPISDKKLYTAVELGLWLYLDKRWSFQKAINKAAEKHKIKPKNAIEKIMRSVIPDEIFLGRMNYPSQKKKNNNSQRSYSYPKNIELDKKAQSHLTEITKK